MVFYSLLEITFFYSRSIDEVNGLLVKHTEGAKREEAGVYVPKMYDTCVPDY